MKDDFDFGSNYIDCLAKKIISDGYQLEVYDFRKRKLVNFDNKSVECYYPILNFLDKTPIRLFTNFIVFLIFCIKNKNSYDVTHILYVRAEFLFSHYFIRRLGKKLIVSIYGNDINKHYKFKRYFTKLYFLSDCIMTTSPDLMNVFLSRYIKSNKQKEISDKAKVLMFPMDSLQDLIVGIKEHDIKNFRSQYNINKEDVLVVCGTTAKIRYEQLDKLVDILKDLDFSKIKNVKFVFCLTYGGNLKIVEEFKEYVKNNLNMDQVILLTDYLPLSSILCLRSISDIYINIRKRDQFVGSMIESFYCGAHVITGSWLPYNILDKKNFFYSKINKIEEVKKILPNIIQDRINESNLDLYLSNKNKILNLWAPDKKLKEWSVFYKEIVS